MPNDATPEKAPQDAFCVLVRPRFSLAGLMLFVAYVALGLATAGAVGGLFSVLVAIGWGLAFQEPSRREAACVVALAGAILTLLAALLIPAEHVRHPRRWLGYRSARIARCQERVRLVAAALRAYSLEQGTYPPASVSDGAGRPAHSWRTLLLPYLGERALYSRYHFDEPWDGPRNRQLLLQIPFAYVCGSDARSHEGGAVGTTSYVAVVGPGTLWDASGAAETDGGAERIRREATIAVLETRGRAIPWTAPDDLSLDEALDELDASTAASGAHRFEDFFCESPPLRTAGRADGEVVVLANGKARDRRRADFLVRKPAAWAPDDGVWERRWRVGNLVRLSLWVVATLAPAAWCWRRSRFAAA